MSVGILVGLLATVSAASWSFAEAKPVPESKLTLSSPAFADGGRIPQAHACDGTNISPLLRWTGAPAGTKSLALICDDPDAPFRPWVHWVVYNLPPATTELSEHVPTTETLSDGAAQGLNGFHRIGYSGPCPPGDKPHRYYFKLYALDTELALKPLATKAELLHVMEGHMLAEAQLMGTYSPH